MEVRIPYPAPTLGLEVSLALALVACSTATPTPCPTAEAITVDPDGDPREWEIIARQCRADRWSEPVIKCLRAAKTSKAQDDCIRQLSAAQRARLDEAFAPIMKEYWDRERIVAQESDRRFGAELATLGMERLVARAPACQRYLDAINTQRKAVLACDPVNVALVQFSLEVETARAVKSLLQVYDPQQLAAECERHATALAAREPCPE